jgi:outer membrane protein OmpA-like peptidoglycan-associated protein
MPPPIRDTIRPSPALRPPGVDANGTVVPGNHFVLDEDVSTVPFSRGSENIDSSGTQTLDKLTSILRTNSGLRVTLTAYADGSGSTPREARRLSLTRALAIRDYLTSKGVASSRVDVRALGTNVQGGDSDRVDIKAN